jgi:hypothetical protein
LVQVHDGVRELRRKGTVSGRLKAEESLRSLADIAHQSLDFRIETPSQFNADGRVILDSFELLLEGFGMKDGTLH